MMKRAVGAAAAAALVSLPLATPAQAASAQPDPAKPALVKVLHGLTDGAGLITIQRKIDWE